MLAVVMAGSIAPALGIRMAHRAMLCGGHFGPWLPGFVIQMRRLFTSRWTPQNLGKDYYFTWHAFYSTAAGHYSVSFIWSVQAVALAIYLALFLLALRLWRSQKPWIPFLFFTAFLPLLLSLVGYVFIQPVFGYALATFLWLSIPVSIIAVAGAMSLPSAWLRYAAVAVRSSSTVMD